MPALTDHDGELLHALRPLVNAWKDQDLRLSLICAGWANTTSLVTAATGQRWILRRANGDDPDLCIHRSAEARSAMLAAAAGLAPGVHAFVLPAGHQVTDYLDGPTADGGWLLGAGISELAEMLRRFHALPGNGHDHEPLAMVRRGVALAAGLPQTAGLAAHLPHLEAVAATQAASPLHRRGLLHGDCFPNNLLRTPQGLRCIDFEFSATGDVWFDLACLSYSGDTTAHENLLAAYWGTCRPEHHAALHRSRYLVAAWDAAWALAQLARGCTVRDFSAHSAMVVHALDGLARAAEV